MPLRRRGLGALSVLIVMIACLGSAAQASAAEEGTISGHVTSAASESGLSGIEVCATRQYEFEYYGEYFEEGYVAVRCETSKAGGSYAIAALPPGSYTVEFATPLESPLNYRRQFYKGKTARSEAQSVTVTNGGTTSGIDAAMQAGARIEGTVTDATTKTTVNGILVCAIERAGEGTEQCAQTTGSGEYSVPSLSGGEYTVEFKLPTQSGLNYLRQFYDGKSASSEAQPVSVSSGGSTTGINAALSQGGQITGTVTDAATKAAIAGIDVCAYESYERCVVTNASGEYSLGGLATGSYYLYFSAPPAGMINYLSQYISGVAVTAGSVTSGKNAALQGGAAISGRVTNAATKAPIQGIEACAYSETVETEECATTNASGEYTIRRLATASYVVYFMPPYGSNLNYALEYYNGTSNYEEATPVSATQGAETSGINAALVEGGRITGVVTNAVTKAAIGAVIVCAEFEYTSRCAATNAAGEYHIGRLPTGSYRVQFAPYNYYYGANNRYVTQYYNGKASYGEADLVAVTTGSTTSGINAALAEAGKVTGTVTNAGTKAALAGVSACAYKLSGEYIYRCAASGSGGEYTIYGLPTGEYRVSFTEFEYVTQYYNEKTAYGEATPVATTNGSTTPGINAAMVEAGKITGAVTNAATKAALSGASICAVKISGEYVGLCAVSGAGGEYTISGLPTGEYRVSFSDTGFVTQYYNGKASYSEATPVSASASNVTPGINGALVEGGKVTGTVTDASTKAAIEGVEVCARNASGEYVSACAFTGAGGEYRVEGLASGEYKIEFGAYASSLNYVPQFYKGKATLSEAEAISVTAGGVTSAINAAMQPGGTISGRVTDAVSKAPVSGAEACASGPTSQCAVTNSNGEYTIQRLSTGSYTVWFYASGQNYVGQYYNGKATFSEANAVSVTAGQATSGVDAALRAGGTIQGTVTNATSKAPISGVDVCAYPNAAGSSVCAFTNASGEYTLTGLASGQYRVEFYGNGTTYATQYYNGRSGYSEAELVTVTTGGTTSGINAAMGLTGTVTGTVTNAATKAGVEGIQVCARRRNGEFGAGCATTGAGGKYTVSGLNPGEYVVEFTPTSTSSNFAPQFYNGKATFAEATGVQVTSGGTAGEINAALIEGGEISGKVTDATTKAAVAGATVCAAEKLAEISERCATTNASGEYTITSLSPGQYRVRFSSSTGEYAIQYYEGASTFGSAQVVAVANGVDVEGLNAALRGGGKIAGVVTAAASKAPIAGIRVCGGESCAITNGGGEYTLIGLGAGEYTVSFAGNGLNYITRYYNEKSKAGEATPVSVTPHVTTGSINAAMLEGGQIAGVVTDSSTKGALAGVNVCATPQGGGTTECATSNVNGEYTVAGLPTGAYHVSFDAEGQNYLTQYYNGHGSAGEANAVAVTVGSTASSINAAMERAGQLSGTVTAAVSKAALGHVQVCATRRVGSGGGCTTTNLAGEYRIPGLPGGEYTVSFNGSAVGYLTQYYNGKSSAGEATAVTITPGATTSGINAALEEGGKISGKVTNAATKAAISAIEIYVYDGSGTQVMSAVTKPNGEYVAEGLPAGQYRVEFVSTSGAYEDQYYSAQSSLASATPIAVTTPGHVTSGINAALSLAGSASSPTIAALSPNRGPEAGGTTVTITGADLGSASAVSFGAVPATSFTVETANRISAKAPAGAPATVDVRVTTPQGATPVGLADRYRYLTRAEVELEEAEREAAEGKPTVTEVSPNAVLQSGGTVTLTGANYEHVEAVTFGGEPAQEFKVENKTRIKAVVPALKTRTCNAQVTTETGTSVIRANNEAECVPEGSGPAVSGLSPKKGPSTGGTTVTVSGSGFSGVTQVLIGGARATQVHVVSETSLTMVVPAHAEGVAEVFVTTPNGTSPAASKGKYKYGKAPAPTVNYVAPASGPVAGGTQVTIGGTNFAASMTFLFGKVPASATQCIATSCTVTSPAATKKASVDIVGVIGKSKGKKSTTDKYLYE